MCKAPPTIDLGLLMATRLVRKSSSCSWLKTWASQATIMEISSIILPAGLSTAAAAVPAPDQTTQGKILLQLGANEHTHLSLRGWSVKNPEKGKKKQLLSQACLEIHPQQKTERGLLSTEEVYTINTFCILNRAAGKFSFWKSLNFKKVS